MTDDAPFRRAPAAPAALVALADAAAMTRRALPREAAGLAGTPARVRLALDVRATPGLATVLLFCVGAGILAPAIAAGSIAGIAVGLAMIPTGVTWDVVAWREARARLARRLRDDAALPFPVEGLELWLAAERPLFDVHLRGEVARDVIERAIAAIDPETRVEWIDARVVRVAIPPRKLDVGDHGAWVGDVARWRDVAARILGPLHQDVGIVRVEMGGSMRALPPGGDG